jgi:3-hydroxy-9,10-secoandrosta-1,3,5(10)-triene-9,17-dione monooxygenase reductase component
LATELDVARLKSVVGHFATGVTIVAGIEGGQPHGFTAQSFHSLSIDPPLILVCPSKTVSSWPHIRDAGAFCVSILARDQEDLAMTFASKTANKFSNVGWTPAPGTGAPMMDGAVAWVDCELDAEHDAGDHTIVVGRVVHVDLAGGDYHPLLFYKAGFGRFQS